jgi:dihydrofolate reductase
MINNLSLIVAIGNNNELGLNNDLVFHIKEDMVFFKETTTNHTVIMGRKTYESLPHLLPNRVNVIITSNLDYQIDGAIILHNEDEVINYVKNSLDECFIIGGASIYKEYLPFCKTLYITEIDANANADVYFPLFDKSLYIKEIIKKEMTDNIKYVFTKYTKKDF